MLSGEVIILHDNAPPHVAVACQILLRQFHWEILEHPAYSSDLSPREYHIFGPLQKALKGRRFASDYEVQNAVENWLHYQHQNFFTQGTHPVVDLWDTCFK
ncbi:mariner Mos1 transposase [Trichonephila clavipes]|uniref:Mariner Mos1 transposase n=1 Tax=Trichonephila clavipes TaxID=2585209 RepID=A0A8X6SPT3_TRICX|nr:mariner Mos1 transposase [Trichonephila clavipes]